MRRLSYAKQVNGGYSITSLNGGCYIATTLPKTCVKTGQPVLLLPAAHDFINTVCQRASTLNQKFIESATRLWNETIKDAKIAREDWDEAGFGLDSNESVELLANYVAIMANAAVITQLSREVRSTAPNYGRMIDGICDKQFGDEASKAGFEISTLQQREEQRPITLNSLLDMIFGRETTGIHDASESTIGEDSGKMAAATNNREPATV